MVAPTCFGITLPSSGSVPSAFWEMLNWGIVDRILWMGVLCLVMWCACAYYMYNILLCCALNISIYYRCLFWTTHKHIVWAECNVSWCYSSWYIYEDESKISRTDAVKIIKLTIRPIGRRHPRSSSLPHVHTGPTVSSISGTLPVSPFLSHCQALSAIHLDLLNGIKPASVQLQFHFWKYEEVTGCQMWGVRWVGDDSHLVFRQKLQGDDGSVRRGIVMAKQPGLFSPKFVATSSQVFTQSPQKRRSRTRNSQFGLLGLVLRATTTSV
jgi:hypothetical protein